MDDCTAGADGEAVCAGDTEKRCDGIVDEQGDGLFPCSTDSQCAAIGAGACTIAVNKPCFAAPITATGVSDPTEPRTVAAVCVPASGNTALDANYGLLGPVRLRTDWTVTMIP